MTDEGFKFSTFFGIIFGAVILFLWGLLAMAEKGSHASATLQDVAGAAAQGSTWDVGEVKCTIADETIVIAAISPTGDVAVAEIKKELGGNKTIITFITPTAWDQIPCRVPKSMAP